MHSTFNIKLFILSPQSSSLRTHRSARRPCCHHSRNSSSWSQSQVHTQTGVVASNVSLPQNWSFLVSKPDAHRQLLLPAMSTYHRTGLSWSQSQVHTGSCCCQQCLLTTELVFPGLKARCTQAAVVASNVYLPQNWSFLVSKPDAHRQVLLPAMSTYHRTGLSWSQSQVHIDRCCCQQCLLTTELVFPGLKARCTHRQVLLPAMSIYLPQNWSFLVSKPGAHRQVLLPAMSVYLPQNWSFLVSKPGAHRQVLLPVGSD